MSTQQAYLNIVPGNSNIFLNANSNDFAIYTQSNTQQIHIGIGGNSNPNIICSSTATSFVGNLNINSVIPLNGIQVNPKTVAGLPITTAYTSTNLSGYTYTNNSNILSGSNFIFNNGTGTIATLTNSGALTLGTSNMPVSNLDVYGSAIMRSNIVAYNTLSFSNSTNTININTSSNTILFPVQSIASSAINVNSGNSSQWSNNSTNIGLVGSNIGIGIQAPSYLLDVGGITMHRSNVMLSNTTGLVTMSNSSNTLYVTSNVGVTGSLSATNIYTNYITLSNTTGSNFIYTSNSYVGIGQSNPAYTLDIAGNLNCQSNVNIVGNLDTQTFTGSNLITGRIWDMSGTMTYSKIPGPISTATITGSNIVTSTLSPFTNNTDGSIYFPGTATNYLTVAPVGTVVAPTGALPNFTIECWIYLSAINSAQYSFIGQYTSWSFGPSAWTGGSVSTNALVFNFNGYSQITGNQTLAANTWNHVALTYTSSTQSVQMFLNGVVQSLSVTNGTATSTNGGYTMILPVALVANQLSYTPAPLTIGGSISTINCYISNLRYTQQVLYTATFIPSKMPLQIMDTTTVLLLKAPLQSSLVLTNPIKTLAGVNIKSVPSDAIIYADCYGTNLPNLSGASAPTFDTTQAKAIRFNSASSQYINFGPQTFNFATQGFTAICKFAYTGAVSSYERIFEFGNGVGATNFIVLNRNNATNTIYAQMYPNGVPIYNYDTTNIAQNVIYTVATRFDPFTNNNGSTNYGVLSIWINGVMTSSSNAPTPAYDYTLSCNYLGNPAAGGNFLNGDIYSFAAYNRALTDKEIQDASAALMSVSSGLVNENCIEVGGASGKPTTQIKQDGTLSISGSVSCANNQSYTPIDMGINKLSVPGAIIGTVPATGVSPFGPNSGEGSLQLAANSYLSIQSILFSWWTVGFSFEMWVNYSSLSNGNLYNGTQSSLTSDGRGPYFSFGPVANGTVTFFYYNGAAVNVTTSTTIQLNTWTHLAVTYDLTTIRIFINGVVSATGTLSGTPVSNVIGAPLEIGLTSYTPSATITNVRLVSGAALYTAAFTPSTTPLTVASSGTTALLLRVPQSQGSLLVKQIGGTTNTQVYPPAALTGTLTNIQNTSYGAGNYIVTASTLLNTTQVPYLAFDKTTTTYWQGAVTYNSSSPYGYTGSLSTVDMYGTAYAGDWLQIQMPVCIVLSSFFVSGYIPGAGYAPGTFVILGSKDGFNWQCINQQTGNTANTNTFNVVTSSAFNYYRIVVQNLAGAGTTALASEWILYGTQSSITLAPDGQVGLGVTNPVQQLEVAGNAIINGQLSATNLGMFRNRIINGDMRINQRGVTNLALVASPNFCVDRIQNYAAGLSGSSLNANQITLTVNDAPFAAGFTYALQSYTNTSTGNLLINRQMIEGCHMADFNWGTAYGVPITVSCWIKTNMPTGSLTSILIKDAAQTQSYSAQYTIKASGQWQYVSVTIPPPAAGSSWPAVAGSCGLQVCYGTSWGNTTGSANVWASGNTYNVSNESVTFYQTAGNYFTCTGLQLEKGTLATAFEYRPFAVELRLCQRYYEVILDASSYNQAFGMAYYVSGTADQMTIPFKVTKAYTPTLAYGSGTLTGVSNCTVTLYFTQYNMVVGVVSNANGQFYYTLNAAIAVNAEF